MYNICKDFLLQLVWLSIQGNMEFILHVVMYRNCDYAGEAQSYEFQDGPFQTGERIQKDFRYFIVKD